MYRYEFTSKALKELRKLDLKTQFRLIDKLDYICNSPNPLFYADHLTDSDLGEYRIRIGDYRIIFDMDNDTLIILKVGHRKYIYR